MRRITNFLRELDWLRVFAALLYVGAVVFAVLSGSLVAVAVVLAAGSILLVLPTL